MQVVTITDFLYTQEEMNTKNCSKINPTNGSCFKCAPLMDGTATGVCAPATDPFTGNCYQLKEDSFVDLKTASSECDMCLGAINKNSTCMPEIEKSINLGYFSSRVDRFCPKGHMSSPHVISSPSCQKMTSFQASQVDNCLLFNSYSLECLKCSPGSSLNDTTKKCEAILPTEKEIYQDSVEEGYSHKNSSKQSSGATGIVFQVQNKKPFSSGSRISRCQKDYIGVLEVKLESLIGMRNGFVNIGTPYQDIDSCKEKNSITWLNNDGDYSDRVPVSNCAFAKQLNSNDMSYCVQCKEGYMGKVFNIVSSNDGAPISPHIAGIFSCEPVSDLEFSIGGLDFARSNIFTNDRLSSYISAGKCNNGKHLVYFAKVDHYGDMSLVDLSVGETLKTSSKVLQYKCVDDLSNIDLDFKDNCQIFGFTPESSRITQSVYDAIPAQHCLSCKPGYRAVLNEQNHIVDCVAISGCDMANAENNMMNACMTCTNKTWVFTPSFVHFDQCAIYNEASPSSNTVTRPLVPNCLFHDDSLITEKPCRFCERGYNVTRKGDCQAMPGLADCSNPSYGSLFNYMLNYDGYGSGSIMKSDQASLLYFPYKYKELMPRFNGLAGCFDCAADELLVVQYDNNINKCSIGDFEMRAVFDPFCKYFSIADLSSKTNCQQCESGFALDTDSNVCLPIEPITLYNKGVFKFQSSDHSYTVFCQEGYTGQPGAICKKENCSLYDISNECTLCGPGTWYDEETETCSPLLHNPEYCNGMSSTDGKCLYCPNENEYMVLLSYNNVSLSTVEFTSQYCQQLDLPQHIKDRYADELIYFEAEYNSQTSKTTTELKVMNHAGIENRLVEVTGGNIDTTQPLSFCTTFPSVPSDQCSTYANGVCVLCDNDLKVTLNGKCSPEIPSCKVYQDVGLCKECETGAVLENNQCITKSIPNCDTQLTTSRICSECDSGFYVNEQGTCSRFTVHCDDYSLNSNECLTCSDSSYLKLGKKGNCRDDPANCNTCEYRNIVNCRSPLKDLDGCSICDTSFYFKVLKGSECAFEDQTCLDCRQKDTSNDCAVSNQFDDSCILCDDNKYYQEVSNKCYSYTALNCKIYNDRENSCLTCDSGFVLFEGNCALQGHETCATLQDDLLLCATCPDGQVLNGLAGCSEYTVSNCTDANLSTTENKCLSCDDAATHFVDYNFNCVSLAEVTECISYHAPQSKCTKCSLEFYLDKPTNSCLPRTADRDCKEDANQVVDEDKCSACDNSKGILQENGLRCDIGDCGSVTCGSGTYFDTSTCQCTTHTVTVDNCDTLSGTYDGCLFCIDGYYLENETTCTAYSNAQNCTSANLNYYSDTCNFCDDEETHYFDQQLKTCLPRTNTSITECASLSQYSDSCGICTEAYYLSAPTTCTLRAASLTCNADQRYMNKDECFNCDDITAKWISTGNCSARSNLDANCQTYDLYQDKCLACNPPYIIDSGTGTCSLPTDTSCLFHQFNMDKCVSCPKNKHFDPNTKMCIENTDPNCVSYYHNSNQCRVCSSYGSHGIMEDTNCEDDPTQCVLCPVLDNNCLLNGDYGCENCKLGFWLNRRDKTCNAHTAENCAVKHSLKDECVTCAADYHLVEDKDNCAADASPCYKCVAKPGTIQEMIPECGEFNTDENDCTKCNDSHYLVENSPGHCFSSPSNCNQCLPRTNTNCTTYEDDLDECISCDQATQYLQINDGDCADALENCNRCMTGTASFCLLFRVSSDHCQKCKEGYWLKSEDSICYQSTITGCTKLEDDEDSCVECSSQYFNDDGECKTHTPVQFCTTYESDTDECSTCSEGYYYNQDDKLCKISPNGPAHCIGFNPDGTCSYCDEGYFTSEEGVCTALTSEVSDCLYHSKDGVCRKCKPSFWLSENSNECLDIIALNCLTLKDPYTCSSCDENYILEVGEFHTNCYHSGISNCRDAVIKGTPICTRCKDSYLLSEDKKSCSAHPSPIENCAAYSSLELCSECLSGFYLNSNKKECLELSNQAGANCSLATKYGSPVCEICDKGYYKDDKNNCIKCDEGCGLCDYSSPSSCMICESGYTMNEDSECVKNSSPPVDPPASIMRLNALMTLLIFLGLIKFE
jgi:hypothetical protein